MTSDTDNDFATVEVARTDCFLCRPATRLLADVGADSFTMAGLGPLAPCYAIVATVEHVDQLKDPAEIEKFAKYVERIRAELAQEFGNCVLTEHGHSPLCTLANTHTVHCYHPHVLLFPATPGIQPVAAQFFQTTGTEFGSLSEALKFGRDLDQYFLASDSPTSFDVYLAKDGLPRQFARALVAEQVGNIDHASWRDFPGFDEAERNAVKLKALFGRGT